MRLLRDLGLGLAAGVAGWMTTLGLSLLFGAVGLLDRASALVEAAAVWVALGSGFALGGYLAGRWPRDLTYRPALLMFSMNLFGPGLALHRGPITGSRGLALSPADLGLFLVVSLATLAGFALGSRRPRSPEASSES